MEILIMPQPLISVRPPHAGGDKDFDGNGPDFRLWIGLEVQRESILHLFWYMKFVENKPDSTTFEGSGSMPLYDIDRDYPGYKIERIITPSTFEHTGTDQDHAVNKYLVGIGSKSLVREIEVMGDKDGGIWGGPDEPWMSVYFNPIRLSLTEPNVFQYIPNWISPKLFISKNPFKPALQE